MDFFVKCYLRLIGVFFKPWLKAYTLVPIFVCMLAVGSILPMLSEPEVAKAIVCPVSVYVVHLFFGYIASHVVPCKAMGRAMLAIDLKVNVPLVVQASGPLPNLNLRPRPRPCENARIWVVSKNLEQFFVRYVFHGAGVYHPLPGRKRIIL